MDHDFLDKRIHTTIGTTEVLITLVLIAIIGAFSTFKWRLRHLEKAAAKLPGPPTLPVIGNALELWGKLEDIFFRLSEITKQYRPLTRFWLGHYLVVFLSKPEDVQIVLNSRNAIEKPSLYRFMGDYAGNGLVTGPAKIWRKHRKIIQPVFNSKLLEGFIPTMIKYNKQLVDKLKPCVDGGLFQFWKYASRLELDIILDTALGIDENTPSKLKSEFDASLHLGTELIFLRTYKVWLHPDFIFNMWLKLWYGYDVKQRIINKVFSLPNTVIEQKKKEYRLKKERKSHSITNGCTEESEPKSKVFIDILLELSDAGANFSDDELRDEVFTMIIAGYDTQAQTNCFCILMLAIHQDIQEKVYDEVFTIFGDSDRDATMDDLKQMSYTEMVLKETLRRFPTVPVYARSVTQDIDLTDHRLPSGCLAAIFPLAMHMDPKVFPHPEMFNPENFAPENIAERHAYSYLPFSGGPRNCIGLHYAMLSMKLTVSTLVRNYRFYTDMKMEDIKLKADMLLRTTNGCPVRVVKRK